MGRKEYGDEVKAAVLAALLVGQSVSSVAKEYNIPKGTVSSWQEREREKLDTMRRDATQQLNGSPPQSDLGSKLARYMEASINSLTSQVEVMGEKEFLRAQDMQQIAVGHGIQMDKFIRLLEAMNRATSEPNAAEN